jgi:hypothetical protein
MGPAGCSGLGGQPDGSVTMMSVHDRVTFTPRDQPAIDGKGGGAGDRERGS